MSSEHDELVRLEPGELAAHLVDSGDVAPRCGVCDKPLTARGNRRFWIRNNRWSRVVIVCGRPQCQLDVRDVPDGTVYSYGSYCWKSEQAQREGAGR